jgi:nitronate monooxygenase
MLTTRFTEMCGCKRPLQLAGMPAIVTPSLACAVAEAGGFPMIPAAGVPTPLLEQAIDEVVSRTSAPFGVNFLLPFLDRDALDVVARRAKVVEFFYGAPDPALVEVAHRSGALVSWQVGSVAEAVAAARAGCDIVIAQGIEAGGHVRGEVAAFPLLAQVLDAVETPVLAAGGIGTAHSMAAALAAGASGVRVGTRFVAAAESGAHPKYVEALLAACAEDTVLTGEFSVMWPDAPHRVLRSSIEAARALGGENAGEFEMAGQTIPIPRLAVYCPSRETTGHVEAMALYAGQSVDAVRRIDSAGDIVRELCDGAEALLARESLR